LQVSKFGSGRLAKTTSSPSVVGIDVRVILSCQSSVGAF
jgi:hypothetical protein